jgi:hypothetical protein
MLVMVVIFALQSFGGDDKTSIEGKDLKASEDNLKKIGKAIHAYVDDHNNVLPRNLPVEEIRVKKGMASMEELKKKVLLSWRVGILPYLGENELYKQFKLDEVWDSENNKKLIEKIPAIYKPVRGKVKDGETYYQGFEGVTDTVFPRRFSMKFPAAIPDGLSNTGMVFESAEPVIWSKPADIPFDKKKPVPKIGGQFDGESLVLLCDGTVIHLKKNPDDEELKNLIMPADGNGEPDWKKLKK